MTSTKDVEARLRVALADRYEIQRRIGEGGMAVVFLAHDLKHDREVAIKVMRPELAASLGAERFLREIGISAKLNHPHILPLHDSGEADGVLFYVMPYVEGESLRDRMEREGQLPLGGALEIAREVADGLGYAHSLDIIHRDIKPENILLSGGHAVVTDFGIARAVSAAGGRITKTGGSVGSPLYMSPEQAAGQANLDGRSDLYSLACLLYEMLAGEPPFSGQSMQALIAKHAMEPPPDVRVLRTSVPGPIDEAIRRALAKSPADRFRTVDAFSASLSMTSADAGRNTPGNAGDTAAAPPLVDSDWLAAARTVPALEPGNPGLGGWPLLGIGLLLLAAVVIGLVRNLGGARSFEAYIIAWAALAGGTWFLFEKTEVAISEETRNRLVRWLKTQDLRESLSGVPSSFIIIFDRVFGERHLSWRCFYRSCFASLLAVLIAFAVWFAFKPHAISLLLHRDSLVNFAWLLLLSGIFNFIPDYLSLLETRYVLRGMDRSGRVFSLIALDAVFTSVISASLIFLAVILFYGVRVNPGSLWGAWLSLAQVSDYFGDVGFFQFWESTAGRGYVQIPLGIFYYSAFVTSIWIWLYLLAWVLVRGLLSLGGGISVLLRVTDVERYPVRSIGYVSVMVISGLFVLGLPFFVF